MKLPALRRTAAASHPATGTAGVQQKHTRLKGRSPRKPVAVLGRMRRAPGTRRLAGLLASLFLFLICAPPAAAFHAPRFVSRFKTTIPDAELREKIDRRERAEREKPVENRDLTQAEMENLWGRGPYRNRGFNGVLPWQRSLRDVNMSNGNLFKSFTDIQVQPARGAGLAWQRTYNSSDDRVGAFGVGWTHAYDIRIEEAPNNKVDRTDFFGGKHKYTRDADGLYSPPPYMFDELSSEYSAFLVEGPADATSDDQVGMDGTRKHFVKNGNARVIDSITDRYGNVTAFTYGLPVVIDGVAQSLLTRVTDPSNRYLDISWTNIGTQQTPMWRIMQVSGPYDPATGGYVYSVAYEYNVDGNLWKVRHDPNGLNRVTTFAYTYYSGAEGGESGLLSSISDPLGHTVSYTYRLDDLTNTLWVGTVTEPSAGGDHIWTISTWYVHYQDLIAAAASSNGGLNISVYSDTSLRVRFMDGASPYFYLYWRDYDTSNNVISEQRMSQFRPEFDNQIWMTDGSTTLNRTYGPHGNLLTETLAGIGSTTSTSYYDGNKYFQKASVTDANGNVSNFDYFDKNDPNPGNRGQVKWVRDADYPTTGQQFEYAYNSTGQRVSETNLNDVVTQYSYGDTWGNLTQVVQDPGAGRLNRTTTMSYDIAGRVLTSSDPKAQQSSFAYNGLGQVTQATLPGETISYGYGGNGRTESVTDGRGTTAIGYLSGTDIADSITDPVTGTISHTYGLAGQKLTTTLPGGGIWTYEYGLDDSWHSLPEDDPGSVILKPARITDDQGRRVEYWLDHYGALKRARFNQNFDGGGGLVSYAKTEYRNAEAGGYSRGALQTITNTWNTWDPMSNSWQSQVLVGNSYSYDANSNRLSNTISDSSGPIRTEGYGYDSRSRLTSVNYGDGQTQGYSFDPMGNRLTKSDSVAGNDTYSYNATNMLLSRNGGAYTNDTNGNTLTGGNRTNSWDGQNRLTQCVYNGNTSTFTYGSDGLRRRSVENGVTTDYVIEGRSAVREMRGASVHATYFHGLRGPEYRRDSGNNVRWYLYDGTGSVLGELDANGYITASRKLDAYGAVRSSAGTSTSRHKFVGGLGHPSEDESGCIYMRARYYDPVTGRFASEDPAKDGANWFAYCRNNPVNNTDSTGLFLDIILGCLNDAEEKAANTATAQAVRKWGTDKIMNAVARHSGIITGHLLAGSLEATFTAAGLEILNTENGRQIFLDFLAKYHNGVPHIDLQWFTASGRRRDSRIKHWLEGLEEGLGIR